MNKFDGLYDFSKPYVFIDPIFDTKPLAAKAPEASKAVSASKTFYVLARPEQNRFAPADGTGNWGWVKTAQQSKRYATLEDAIRAFPAVQQRRLHGTGFYPLSIIKVTEVPGKTELRIVSKTKIDATKPVVLFNQESGTYQKRVGMRFQNAGLQDATVFPDLGELLHAMVRDGEDAGSKHHAGFPLATLLAYQVETITTPSTFTEVEVK